MKSIKTRLLSTILAGTFILFLGYAVSSYLFQRNYLLRHYDSLAESQALALAGMLEVEDGEYRLPMSSEFIEWIETDGTEAGDLFQIFDLDGREIARSPSLSADLDMPTAEQVRELRELDDRIGWYSTLPDGEEGRSVAVVLDVYEGSRQEPVGEVLIVVATTNTLFQLWMKSITIPVIVGTIMLFLGIVVLVQIAVRSGLLPVTSMGREIAEIDASTIRQRIGERDLPQELKPIATQTNALLDRLQAALEREQRTTSNIAHELRTPIAELRGLAEVAAGEQDSEFTRRAIGEFQEIAINMANIVDTLLKIARTRSGERAVEIADIDAARIARDMITSVEVPAGSRDIRLELEGADDIRARTDPSLLALLMQNLLMNAVHHAPEHDTIICRLSPIDDLVRFTIENTNPGLEPDDLKHLHEPFWQKDDARSDSDHAGLGFTLVHELAEAAGLRLTPSLNGGRFVVTLDLPAAG